jgi:sugar phosphate isomerase/epimerase
MMEQIIHVNVPYKLLLDQLDFILERGLNPEIYFNGEALDTYREDDVNTIHNSLKKRGLKTTIHAPFMDLSPGGVDAKIKKSTLERLNQTLEVGALFAPRLIVFHPGYNKWFFDNNVDLWLENSLVTWNGLLRKAKQFNIPLAVENIFEEEPSSLFKLISKLNSPYFNFCFDTGHFNLFSTVTMEEWFIALGTFMKEVHLHDNNKDTDDHLPLGDGGIDFPLFFQLLKKYEVTPIYTIEPHKVEDLERSLERCHFFLKQQ